MANNIDPIFVLNPETITCTIAAANTARDGSGTLVTLYPTAAVDRRLEKVVFTSAQATAAASSAMVGRVFISDTAGANPRLIGEVAIATATASNTVVGATASIAFPGGLPVASGQIVYVTQSIYAGVQDKFHVYAVVGAYE